MAEITTPQSNLPTPGEAVVTPAPGGDFTNVFDGGETVDKTTAENLVADYNVNKAPKAPEVPTPPLEDTRTSNEKDAFPGTDGAHTMPLETGKSPGSTGPGAEEDFVNKAIEDLEVQRQAQEEQLDAFASRLDERGKKIVEDIKRKFAIRKTQMEQSNKAMLAGFRKAGITSGRQRLVTELNDQLLTNEERAGIARMAELDAEESSAISQAQSAADDKDFQLLDLSMRKADAARQEKFQMLTQQFQMALTQEDQMFKRAQQKREETKFKFLEEDRNIESLVSSLGSILSGDEVADNKLIESEAAARGIDPNRLRSALNQFTQQQKEADLDMATKYLNVAQSLNEGETFTDPNTGVSITGRKKQEVQVTQKIGNKEYMTTYDMSDPKNPKVISRILTNDRVRVGTSSGTTQAAYIAQLKNNLDFVKRGGSINKVKASERVDTFNALVDQQNVSLDEYAKQSGATQPIEQETVQRWREYQETAKVGVKESIDEMKKASSDDDWTQNLINAMSAGVEAGAKIKT